MICIRLVVSHDDNDVDEVAMVVEITSATVVVVVGLMVDMIKDGTGVVVPLFDVNIHRVIAITWVVAFSEINSLSDAIPQPNHTHSQAS